MDIRLCIVRVGVGSGVLVQGKNYTRYILTCTHVLGKDWQAIEIAFCDEEGDFSQKTQTKTVLEPAPIGAEDIALLVCPDDIPTHYQAVKLLHSKHGRELPAYTYGFPSNFSENGRDDRCRIDKLGVRNNTGYELLKLSEGQAIKGGFSGGPLLDARYQHCLGIISDLERPDIDNSATLTYALPAETITTYFADYLEVQGLSPYQARLREMYQEVVLNDPKGMTLADIYLEPNYGVHRYCFDEKDERIKKRDAPFIQFERSLHQDLARILNQENCLNLETKKPGLILLLGYPGQGKTSFCKRLIYDLTDSTPHSFSNIYFIRLRNIPNPSDLANNALKVIQTEIEEEVDSPVVDWKNAILILDGLDELNIKEGFHGGKIDDICKSLEEGAEKHTGLHIIMSSRYGYVDVEALKKRNILILRLEEFSKTQQLQWLEVYRVERFHPESSLTPEKLEKYHKHTSIRELLGQAILLHMIAALEEDASNKPNRAAIYNSLFNQLVKRTWSDQGQISLLKDIGLDQKMLRSALQDIAHAIYMSGKGYLRRADLEQLPKVKTIQSKLQQSNRGIDLWRTVMVAAYLGEKKKSDDDVIDESDRSTYGIEFLHKSLYEYLCAEKMWREISNGFLNTNRDGDWSINQGKEALQLANEVFSACVISQEVHDYLVEIIGNHEYIEEKKQLADRMAQFLPYCLERHFLYKFDANLERLPFEKVIASFRGYWTVLSNLEQSRNFFSSDGSVKYLTTLCCNRSFENSFIRGFKLNYQNLSGIDLRGVDLSGADLSEVDLSGADLRNAILVEANLRNANLRNANLNEADLYKVDLRGADLSRTLLNEADLTYADLVEANLSRADLNGTKLRRANLNGADLSGAFLMHADLSDTIANFEQLLQCRTLFKIKGLSLAKIDELKTQKPSIFDQLR